MFIYSFIQATFLMGTFILALLQKLIEIFRAQTIAITNE